MVEGRSKSLDPFQPPQPLSRNFLYRLTTSDRQQFLPLATIQLESSSYNRYPSYRQLVELITCFNAKLEKWGKGQQPISNILMQYNLHSNLSTRLMSLRLLADEERVLREIEAIKRWFATARMPEIQRQMGNIAGVLQAIKNYKKVPVPDDKDNVPMYKQMNRTKHQEFRPPKERLGEFKRRELITPSTDIDPFMTTKQTFFSDKAPSFDLKITKGNIPTVSNFAESTARDSTDKKTPFETTIASAEKQQQIQGQAETIEPQLQVQEQQDPGVQYQQQQQPPQTNQYKKPYTSDALYKKPQQRSQLRTADVPSLSNDQRFLLSQQKDYRVSIQDEKDAKQLLDWQRAKSKQQTQLQRKSQAARQVNQYKKIEFLPKPEKVIMEEEFERARERFTSQRVNKSEKVLRRNLLLDQSDEDMLPQKSKNLEGLQNNYQSERIQGSSLTDRKMAPIRVGRFIQTNQPFASQSQNPLLFLAKAKQIQCQIRQTRLTKTIDTYSKYIRHTSESHTRRSSNPDTNQFSTLRQATLTGYQRQRSNSFGDILQRYHADNYNTESQTMVEKIKAALSSKGVAMSGKVIGNSLRVPMDHQFSQTDNLYKPGDKLISNPFFPKSLGKKKKKKKK